MPTSQNEAFSRVLIDKALEFSGWQLLNPKEVRFEMTGSSGRADYVLSGQRGPLAVLEAKKEDVDPYDAKEQARGYAENLKAPRSAGSKPWRASKAAIRYLKHCVNPPGAPVTAGRLTPARNGVFQSLPVV